MNLLISTRCLCQSAYIAEVHHLLAHLAPRVPQVVMSKLRLANAATVAARLPLVPRAQKVQLKAMSENRKESAVTVVARRL